MSSSTTLVASRQNRLTRLTAIAALTCAYNDLEANKARSARAR